MLRRSFVIALAVALSIEGPLRAQDEESFSSEWTVVDEQEMPDAAPPAETEMMEFDPPAATQWDVPPDEPPPGSFWPLGYLGLRHSHTHGRHVGIGQPFTGTSWRNRPYYVGFDSGGLWVSEPPIDHVGRDIDPFGGLFIGCDWDHYWGAELAVHRSTPELVNKAAPPAHRGDRFMLWTASLMYYPLGDAAFRPYARCGVGASEIDFPTDAGQRHDETLWTIPIGAGFKYPLYPWLAARTELTDQLAIGNTGINTMHNISLTIGLEWRFGAHPRSYWPWNPHRHIW